MPLSDQDLSTIAAAIAVAVPEDLLARIVSRQNKVPKLADLRKSVDDPVHGRLHGLARAILDEYNAEDKVHELLLALYRQVDWSPQFSEAISPFAVQPDLQDDARQALHRRRDHFISSVNLLKFTREFEPRICCLVGEYLREDGTVAAIGGTGFLLAPAIVLTAAHVLEDAIKAVGEAAIPSHCAVFFDYVDSPRIKKMSDRRNDLRRVQLAPDWLMDKSASLPDDGTVDPDNEPRKVELAAHLDFALIKLAEPVGQETVGVGRRRGWIDLPDDGKILLGKDSYVNIAQHPDGDPRQIGFGRYTKPCPSQTRFWYDTETDHGASGAPCLTRDLELIGMHNAEFVPLHYNQAIDIRLIAGKIRSTVEKALKDAAAAPPPPPPPIWNIAEDGTDLRVVLGRGVFLNWLERAMVEPADNRAKRLYAAVDSPKPGEDPQEKVPWQKGSGKTFSLKILERVVGRVPGQKVIAFGTDIEGLPKSLEDMIRVLADHLGVPSAKLSEMPKRPQADLPNDAPDGDKLRLWASETVPDWFAEVVKESRPRPKDARQNATAEVAQLKAEGKSVPEKLSQVADSPEPVWIEDGWRTAWVVLDGLAETRLSGDLRDLIGGLIGSSKEENDVPAILRRLRWVFLGYRPDFIVQGDIIVEVLDPAAVDADHAVAPLRNAWASRGIALGDDIAPYTGLFSDTAEIFDLTTPPDSRLKVLQRFLGVMIRRFLPKGLVE